MTPQFVTVSGLKLRYVDTGGPGLPIILTHGITGSLEYWAAQLEGLGRNHRIIAWDAPNHGLSDLTGKTEDWDSYARSLLAFADAIGVQAFIAAGNSMGGALSLRAAGLAPERVKGLVLVNAASIGKEITPIFKLFVIPFLGEAMNKPSEAGVGRQIGALVKDPSCVSPELRAVLLRNASRPGATAAFLATLRATLGFRGQNRDLVQQSEALMAGVRCPTLIIHGKQDAVIPYRHSENAARIVPGARLVVFDPCGHTPQVERPEDFNAELAAFVASLG